MLIAQGHTDLTDEPVSKIRVPVCARVSRVCPGSPRCLFTGIGDSDAAVLIAVDTLALPAYPQCYPQQPETKENPAAGLRAPSVVFGCRGGEVLA